MFLEQLQTVSVGGRGVWGEAPQIGFAGPSLRECVYAPSGVVALSRLAAVSQLCILLVAKWQNEDRNGKTRVEPELRLGGWGGVCVISVHSAKSRGL